MAKNNLLKKITACFTAGVVIASTIGIIPVRADSYRIVTLGADLSEEQKQTILAYFNVSEGDAQIITVTNEDEHRLLDGQFTAEEIGTHTYSCAMINPTGSGGVQAKTANMSRVTADTIIGQLSTSGVANCEVLTSAPFMVSGTGALTGVLMAYETASGTTLDPEKKETAVVETKTTNEVAEKVGQDGATLVVNDIKIRIVRDQEEPVSAVDDTLSDLEDQLAQLAEEAGTSGTIDDSDRESLYSYGERVQEMNYDYDSMKVTLQRVTNNIVERTGINDPIQETFEDLSAEDVLPENSILRETNDDVMGEEANITATNEEALAPVEEEAEEEPAEPAPVEMPKAAETEPAVTDISLTKELELPEAIFFISGTNLIQVRDPSNSSAYGLFDLNGNMVADYHFGDFSFSEGLIEVSDSAEPDKRGVLTLSGAEAVPVRYDEVMIFGTNWAGGVTLKPGTENDHDYWSMGGSYYQIDTIDLYYNDGNTGTLAATLSRDEFKHADAEGPYINIQSRSTDVITTYDSTFNFVMREPGSVYDFTGLTEGGYTAEYDRESKKYALCDSSGNPVTAPFADHLYSVYEDSAKFGIDSEDGETVKYGLINIHGEELLPAVFDEIAYNQGGPINADYSDIRYGSGGYYQIELDGKTGYAAAGGVITCEPQYESDALRIRGASAYFENPDGSFRLIAADGVETDLPKDITRLSSLYYTNGFLYSANGEDHTEQLLDWHGNVLLSGFFDYSTSADGKHLLAQSKDRELPGELYEISYLADGALWGDPAVQEETSETGDLPEGTEEVSAAGEEAEAPAQDSVPAETDETSGETSESADKEKLITVLENTITTLADIDFAEKKDAISQILQQEIDLVSAVSPEAAAEIQSAKELVDAGTADAETVKSFLEKAISILRG